MREPKKARERVRAGEKENYREGERKREEEKAIERHVLQPLPVTDVGPHVLHP